MMLLLYKTYLRVLILLFWMAYPLTGVLLPIFIPWAKKRKNFELKNLKDPLSRAHPKADFCFGVSSEGELEQVMPLVEYFLLEEKIIELIFSSKSVEKKILDLANKYPQNLFIYRLPLISFSPFSNLSWVKADILILCRYDFYPHLILEGFKKKRFVLLSASLKGKKRPSLYPYCFFDLIVAASKKERKNFEDLLGTRAIIWTMDLRVIRIISRIEKSSQTLSKASSYLEKLESIPSQSRIILGSFYPEEMAIFENKNLLKMIEEKKLHICIVPHKLGKDNILKIQQLIPKNLKTQLIKDNSKLSSLPDISIVLIPGILCELYTFFGNAYVGGGFLKSIHSVLEPYLAGCKICCGPKTHRSTEFDFVTAHSKEIISVVTNLPDFYDYLDLQHRVKKNIEFDIFKEDLKKIIKFLEEGIGL